jgi:hypothetical protein
MGSISFQVVGDASVGTRSKTFAVPDEHINRLVACMKADDPLTTPQALLKWAELMMQLTKERVLEHERRAHVVPPFEAS